MWYNFIDGRVLLALVIIGVMWLNYFLGEEYARRKSQAYDKRDMCKECGEHISDPHAIGCTREDM